MKTGFWLRGTPDLIYIYVPKKKKKTGKKETKKLEVVSSALMGLLGIDTLM